MRSNGIILTILYYKCKSKPASALGKIARITRCFSEAPDSNRLLLWSIRISRWLVVSKLNRNGYNHTISQIAIMRGLL